MKNGIWCGDFTHTHQFTLRGEDCSVCENSRMFSVVFQEPRQVGANNSGDVVRVISTWGMQTTDLHKAQA